MSGENENLNFHYERGSFRKHEEQIYSDLATGKTVLPKGMFKVLTFTKGNRLVFFTLIMFFALAFIITILNGTKNSASVDDVNFKLSAFAFDDSVYASCELKNLADKKSNGKKSSGKKKSPQEIDYLFECENIEGSICDKKEGRFIYNPQENENIIRAVFKNYDIKKVYITLKIQDAIEKLEALVK